MHISVVAWRQEVGVGAKGTLWNDKNILYVDCGGSYKIVYFCQNSSHCPLKTGDFFVRMLDSSKSDFTIVVLGTMFPCCWPEDRVSECWRGWVRASVGIVQKGQQPGQQELWQLYGRHQFLQHLWGHVTFLSTGVPIISWEPHLTTQVKLPIPILWRRGGHKRSLRKWKEKYPFYCDLELRPGQHLTQAPSPLFWCGVFALLMEWLIQPGLAEHFPGPGLSSSISYSGDSHLSLISRVSCPRRKSRQALIIIIMPLASPVI